MRVKDEYLLEALEQRLLLSADGISGVAPGGSDPFQSHEQHTFVSEVFESSKDLGVQPVSASHASSENVFEDLFQNAEDLSATEAGSSETASDSGLIDSVETVQADSAGVVSQVSKVEPVLNSDSKPVENHSDFSLSEQLVETLRAANGPP